MAMHKRDGYYEFDILVGLREGLHFRPMMELIEAAGYFSGEVLVGKVKGEDVETYLDARSPFDVVSLVATYGELLRFRFAGSDEDEAQRVYSSIEGILSGTK